MGKIKTLALKTIRQCIVEFLLYEYHAQKSTTIDLNMTKKELAEKTGVQRPSLSRELNKMRKDGLITCDSKQISIVFIQMLREAVKGNVRRRLRVEGFSERLISVRGRLEKHLRDVIAVDMVDDFLSEIRKRDFFSVRDVLKHSH